jgi:hypothetical protein
VHAHPVAAARPGFSSASDPIAAHRHVTCRTSRGRYRRQIVHLQDRPIPSTTPVAQLLQSCGLVTCEDGKRLGLLHEFVRYRLNDGRRPPGR